MDTAQQFKKHANGVSYYDDGRGSMSQVVRIQEWVEWNEKEKKAQET